jgi:hypothetical protein
MWGERRVVRGACSLRSEACGVAMVCAETNVSSAVCPLVSIIVGCYQPSTDTYSRRLSDGLHA